MKCAVLRIIACIRLIVAAVAAGHSHRKIGSMTAPVLVAENICVESRKSMPHQITTGIQATPRCRDETGPSVHLLRNTVRSSALSSTQFSLIENSTLAILAVVLGSGKMFRF